MTNYYPRTQKDNREYRFNGKEPHEPNAATRLQRHGWPLGAIATALRMTDAKVKTMLDKADTEERQGF